MKFTESYPNRNWVYNYLIPALLFAVVFIAIIATIRDYGLTWDEPLYIQNANAIESWFVNLLSDSSFFSEESLENYWYGGSDRNVHPPFFKLSAILFRHLIGTSLFENIVFQYRISTAFWTAILVVMLFLVIRKFTRSNTWGLLGGLLFISMPRFFVHAHLFSTDMIITSLGFSGLAVFLFASKSSTRILFGGVLFGAALASKFTGVLALAIVVPLILISDDRRRFVREYALMVVTASLCFSIFNLPMLFDPYRELSFYFSSFFNRSTVSPLTTVYFGKAYDFNSSLSLPWVMFGTTIPSPVVLTAFVGLVLGAINYAVNRDRFAYFATVPFLLLMGVYMLPSTPKHDGIRLFSSAWPFIILLSVYGCYRLQELFKAKFRIGMLICTVSLLLSVRDLRAFYPHGLSYYNGFIGGAKGAQDKGLTVSYWYEAFNEDFYRQMAQIVGDKKVRIYSWPHEEIILYNQEYGLFPKGLQSVGENEDYEYILVLNRYLYSDVLVYLNWCLPLIEIKTKDGALIGGLYQNQRNKLWQ